MGKGTDDARALGNLVHANVIDTFKEQLLIAFLHRLGDRVSIPVSEVDATDRFVLKFSVNDGTFNFVLERKQ